MSGATGGSGITGGTGGTGKSKLSLTLLHSANDSLFQATLEEQEAQEALVFRGTQAPQDLPEQQEQQEQAALPE